MMQTKSRTRTNITFTPFNQLKVSSPAFGVPDVRTSEDEEETIPEYEIPKTAIPPNFEILFNEIAFYPLP